MSRRVRCPGCEVVLTVGNSTTGATCPKCKTVMTIAPPEARVASGMDTVGNAGAALFQIGCGLWAAVIGVILLLGCLVAIWSAITH